MNSRIRIRILVRGMNPRIRIHTKMSWIRNNGCNVCIDSVTVWRSIHSSRSHPPLVSSACFQQFFPFPRVGVKWGCQAATAASSSWFSSSTSCSGSSDWGSSLSGKIGKWESGSSLDLLSSSVLWIQDLILQDQNHIAIKQVKKNVWLQLVFGNFFDLVMYPRQYRYLNNTNLSTSQFLLKLQCFLPKNDDGTV